MSIFESAFFAVLKVFWKGVWGKASFPKEAFRFTIKPSDCRIVAPILSASVPLDHSRFAVGYDTKRAIKYISKTH